MFRKMITTVREFIQECNTPEMKKLRQQAAMEGRIHSTRWTMYIG